MTRRFILVLIALLIVVGTLIALPSINFTNDEIVMSTIRLREDDIPKGLDLSNLSWSGKSAWPYDEKYVQPAAEALRRTAQYLEANGEKDVYVRTQDWDPFLDYDWRKIIEVRPYPQLGDQHAKTDPYIYKMGQETLPNWEGEKPDLQYVLDVLRSFESREPAWLYYEDTYVTWTDGLQHRFKITCDEGQHLLVLDHDCVLGPVSEGKGTDDAKNDASWLMAICAEYRNGEWDGSVVRHNATFAKVDGDGQLVTYEMPQEINIRSGFLWDKTGYWPEIGDRWYSQGCVVKSNDFFVVLSEDALCIYCNSDKEVNVPIDYAVGRLYRLGCGCVVAITDVGSWIVSPPASQTATSCGCESIDDDYRHGFSHCQNHDNEIVVTQEPNVWLADLNYGYSQVVLRDRRVYLGPDYDWARMDLDTEEDLPW